jgi:NAD(P)-dependent dehydrogenase (short-subunit alcohol dehydrogenase family)
MSSQMKLANRTAVVTGAASGIGRALALTLARRGCHLALADINEAGLARTVELISLPGLRITCHRLDVADAGAVTGFAEAVRALICSLTTPVWRSGARSNRSVIRISNGCLGSISTAWYA